MAVSPFFNSFNNANEQELLEDLVVESIKIYGQDMYYIPKILNNFDKLYYEDDLTTFEDAYPIEIYIKSVDGFGGQGSFLSKFGLEIRDQVIFTIARRTFDSNIKQEIPTILRPREGDLIYFPLNKKLFEIKYVDNKPFFYQFGELQMYDLTCELYEYSAERFTTGISDIDVIEEKHTIDVYDHALVTSDEFIIGTQEGDVLVTHNYEVKANTSDPLRDNLHIDQTISSNSIIDWSESNPFAEKEPY